MATIRQRGTSYQIRASAGYDTKGKQIIKTMTWTPPVGMTVKQTEKELNRVVVEFEHRVQTGQYFDASIRFSEYAEIWMKRHAEDGESPLAPKTFANYRDALRRIDTAIGHIKLDSLQPHHINEFLKNLREGGIRDGITYKPTFDLRATLKQNGMKQKELAEKIGVAMNTVQLLANGNAVAKTTATNVCKELGLKFSDSFAPSADGKLSNGTVLKYYRIISAILQSAVVDDNILLLNPAKRTRPPKSARTEPLFLDEVQAAKLLEYLDSEPPQFRAAVRTLLFTGLRRGELLGLKWSDVSFKDGALNVSRSSQYLPGKGIFTKSPKNESSERVIKLPSLALDTLREYKAWQNEQRLALGDLWQDEGLIFTQWNGKPMHPDTLSGWFVRFVKEHSDLPQIHLHSLRHTNATLLIAAGQNIQTVSKRLGHAKTSTTSDIYAHAIKSADARAAEVLDDILNPMGKKH